MMSFQELDLFKQTPVVDEIKENETNLDGFLPHVVVEKEAGVPRNQTEIKASIRIIPLFWF